MVDTSKLWRISGTNVTTSLFFLKLRFLFLLLPRGGLSSSLCQGCGFVEFSASEEADRAIKLNGRELLGRYVLYHAVILHVYECLYQF